MAKSGKKFKLLVHTNLVYFQTCFGFRCKKILIVRKVGNTDQVSAPEVTESEIFDSDSTLASAEYPPLRLRNIFEFWTTTPA